MGYGHDEDLICSDEDLAEMTGYDCAESMYQALDTKAPKRDSPKQLLRTRIHTAKTDNANTGIKAGQTYRTSYYQQGKSDGSVAKWSRIKIIKS